MDRLAGTLLILFALAILGLSLVIYFRPEPAPPVNDNLEHLEDVKSQIDSILYELKQRDNETVIMRYIQRISEIDSVTDNDSILLLVDCSIRALDSIDKGGWDRLYRDKD